MADPLDNLTSSETLRRLLLQEEQERLDRLEARLGDDEALRTSLIPIIADVLRDAGVQDYRRLASSLAPVVLQSIKTEIHNSRDMMVDALYPITGRLVAAAVRNAFKDLVDQLNEKLDNGLSVDRWRARIKARMTGRSEAEILLSEGAAFEIKDLLLINRQTGLLLTQAGPDAEQGGMDSQLLGSILTAIMAFVRDAMHEASEQDLRTLHVGDLRLHLQVSPGVILAIKTRGPPPGRFDSALNETFCSFLAQWGDMLSDPDQIESHQRVALADDLEERFQFLLKARRSNFKGSSRKGTILLASLALLAIGWIGWSLYGEWEKRRKEAAAYSVIAEQAELAGYPLQVRYSDDDNTLAVTGLTPDDESLDRLRKGLDAALEGSVLVMNVSALPQQKTDLSDIPTDDDLAAWRTALQEDMAEAIDGRTAPLTAAIEPLTAAIEPLTVAIARVERELPTEGERQLGDFRRWLEQQALGFDDGSRFNDDAEADRLLGEMAARLTRLPADVGLLIVGYADDRGDQQASLKVSLDRAVVVSRRLQNLGIASGRLAAVGRSTENRISQGEGPGNANRRVEFELTFPAGR